MMEFRLKTPCPHCPFRSDIRPYLRRGRVEDLRRELNLKTFACHETTGATCEQPRDEWGRFAHRIEQHCAGALILGIKTDSQGQLQQVAERLGMYDRRKLNMVAPVYETWEAMIEAQER
jgi:hypothetical protein